MEQELYQQEGIVIPGSSFVDNQPTLDLLEMKGVGIFSMCDEEISVPRGSDDGFLKKVLAKYADGKHANCLRPNVKDVKEYLQNFGILHYAGPVFYNVTNFLDKNKDQLHGDIVSALSASNDVYITALFPTIAADPKSRGGTKVKTLGGQFKEQLANLIDTLNSTFPHFVRCLKPNDEKAANRFHSGRMQDQLRYAGLLEVCRIRKLGFPVRRPFDEFFRRFRCCDLLAPNIDALCASLQQKGVLLPGEWAKGHTRLFMRTKQAADLELVRETALGSVALLLQRMGRGMIARQKYRYFKSVIATLRDAISQREEVVLAKAVDMTFELPHKGLHLKVVQEGKALLQRVREENKVLALLQNAVTVKELNALKSAVAAALSMVPPFMCPLVTEAQVIIQRLEAEIAAKNALTAAIASRDHTALTSAIAQAQTLGLNVGELQQAIALKARVEQENECIANIENAIRSKNWDALSTWMSHSVELGKKFSPIIAAYEQIHFLLIVAWFAYYV